MNIVISCVIGMMGLILMLINNKYIKKLGIIFFVIGISSIAALRPISSADTKTYEFYYNYSKSITHYSFLLGRNYFLWIENWYINLCSVFSKNGVSFRVFLFVVAFSINVISIFSLHNISEFYSKRNTNDAVLLVLFVTNYGFLYAYAAIRGGIAFAFSLLAISKYLQKKYIPGIISFLIAVAMHNSSIAVVLIILMLSVSHKRLTAKKCLYLLILALVCSLARIDVIITKFVVDKFSYLLSNKFIYQFGHYLLDAEITHDIKKGTVLIILQSIYLVQLYKNQIAENREIRAMMGVLIIGSYFAVLINDNATLRLTNYFTVYQIVLFVNYISNSKKREWKQFRNYQINCLIITVLLPVLNAVFILRYCSII